MRGLAVAQRPARGRPAKLLHPATNQPDLILVGDQVGTLQQERLLTAFVPQSSEDVLRVVLLSVAPGAGEAVALGTALRDAGLGLGVAGQRVVVCLRVAGALHGVRGAGAALRVSRHLGRVGQGQGGVRGGLEILVVARLHRCSPFIVALAEDAEQALHVHQRNPFALQARLLALHRALVRVVGSGGLLVAGCVLLANRRRSRQNRT
mmetsp:Transcript_61386/g.146374  ORF Transcript_61386/g.146374 Transcript_61386/m.146374 type:complete len:207 (+) Transcript_61386:505-1125(+)